MERLYDVVIPTVKRDISFLPWVVKYIRMNLSEAGKIFIITKQDNMYKIQNLHLDSDCIVLDENKLFESLNFKAVGDYLKSLGYYANRTGWYFQQFLKYGFAFNDNSGKYYLSWDSDTIPLSHIKFFQEDYPVFTLKQEYHEPYFRTLRNLLGLEKQRKESFIAEHMLFDTDIVKKMISEIEKRNPNKLWWQACLDAIEFTGEENYFSEFENYGNYTVANNPNAYRFQKLNTFRSAGMIKGRNINDKMLERLAIDLDIVSFEVQDAPFPYNVKSIVQKWENKLYKLSNLPLKDIFKMLKDRLYNKK